MIPTVFAQGPSPDEIHNAVDEVLSRPEYRPPGESLIGRVLRPLVDKIRRVIERFFDTLEPIPTETKEAVGVWTQVIAAVLLIAVVSVLVWYVLKRRSGRAASAIDEDTIGRPPKEWLEDAERYEQAGDLKEALRCRYRHTISVLASKNFVNEVPGRTTGEVLGDVKRSVPNAKEPFTALTRRFESVWYGGAEAIQDDLVQSRRYHDEVVAATGSRLAVNR